ncbi:sugar phosphate isomerase/epimerase [Lewinella sp. 4G2]|uniref:sugar phosphate isomerase/epimerase family protein n=1 Tax=Lewinella sp. 4G2 TaxID=1803372 RepID=UPI0007E282C7|nr:TIM barrel protein [Lewinella sp. 4G2]OAV43588.1 hypothetical protein A3850_003345 [Lewinella sp. 4G2]
MLPKKYPLGLQLYGVRDDMASDPIATLDALQRMGYQHFEVYGLDADRSYIYGHPCRTFRDILHDRGLRATSGHFSFHEYLDGPEVRFWQFVDRVIAAALDLELDYITWPTLAPAQRNAATIRRLPNLFNRIGERARDAGLGFAFHNNGYEFFDYGGVVAYDLVLRETDPALVRLQLDMYWVLHAGVTTPKAIVEAHPGRFVMWHLKDMHPVSRDYTEFGTGTIDYPAVLPDPELAGLQHCYLEQGGNFAESALRSAAVGAGYYFGGNPSPPAPLQGRGVT